MCLHKCIHCAGGIKIKPTTNNQQPTTNNQQQPLFGHERPSQKRYRPLVYTDRNFRIMSTILYGFHDFLKDPIPVYIGSKVNIKGFRFSNFEFFKV